MFFLMNMSSSNLAHITVSGEILIHIIKGCVHTVVLLQINLLEIGVVFSLIIFAVHPIVFGGYGILDSV